MSSLELIFLALDEYDLKSLAASLKDEQKFFDEYFFEDPNGFWSVESACVDSYENILLMMKYLFGSADGLAEIFQADYARIFDLSGRASSITTSEKLEEWYQDWIVESKRDNTMNEYGQLICLIGYVQKNKDKKHLLMIVQDVK